MLKNSYRRLISRKPSTHISTEDIVEFFQELDGSISKSKLRKFLDKTMDTAEFCNQITNLTGQTMLHVLASKVRKINEISEKFRGGCRKINMVFVV